MARAENIRMRELIATNKDIAGRVENLRPLYVKEVQSISAGSPAPIRITIHGRIICSS
jgi:hypothetical protein